MEPKPDRDWSHPVEVVRHKGDYGDDDLLDGSERVVRRASSVEVDEGEHGGLWIAFASRGRSPGQMGYRDHCIPTRRTGTQAAFFSSLLGIGISTYDALLVWYRGLTLNSDTTLFK